MVTVQQIYDMAIHLMDEQSETNGDTQTTDTAEYQYRTISILNSVIPALAPYSGSDTQKENGRPSLDPLYVVNYKEPNFDQVIPLDDSLALACLPYYLAAQLLSSENDTLANWFMTQYRTAFADLKTKMLATFEPISMPYGTF